MQILYIVRIVVPPLYFNSATRIFPSVPVVVDVILPNSHFAGGSLSSLISASWPTWTFALASRHFGRCCNVEMYSWFHLCQNLCVSCFAIFQRVNLDTGTSVTSWSGTTIGDSPSKKWPGVNAVRSSGSSVCAHSGLELRHASPSLQMSAAANQQSVSDGALPTWRRPPIIRQNAECLVGSSAILSRHPPKRGKQSRDAPWIAATPVSHWSHVWRRQNWCHNRWIHHCTCHVVP